MAGADETPRTRQVRTLKRGNDAVLADLGVRAGTPVLVIIGGASRLDQAPEEDPGSDVNDKRRKAIENTFAGAVRPVVRQTGAVVLTGGTDAGVMRIAGQALEHATTVLVGVAPEHKVLGDAAEAEIEPHHSAILLTEGRRWGSETEQLFELAEAITAGVAPGLVCLANGGQVALEEATRFLRGGWPVATVSQSGGAADDLLEAVASQRDSDWGNLREADVEQLPTDAADARRQLLWRLHPDDVLKSAWTAYASYDEAAGDLKQEAKRWRIALGLATFLLLALVTVVVQAAVFKWVSQDGQHVVYVRSNAGRSVLRHTLTPLRWAIVALPVGIAVAVAVGTFSGSHQKWRAVRAAAETLKREIYRYRASTATARNDAGSRLVAMLSTVDDQALRGGVALAERPTAIVRRRPRNVDSDELDELTAKIYIKLRLEQQLLWFQRTSVTRTRQERIVVAVAALTAGIATVLAGSKFAAWVAFLVLAASAFSVARERRQTREEIGGYDRAVAEVNIARLEWLRQPQSDRAMPQDVYNLVQQVESAFEREGLTWSEVMRRAAQGEQHYSTPGI